jgi:hypothetical protein
VNFFGKFLSEPMRKLRDMILGIGYMAIFIPFSRLRLVNGSGEVSASRNTETPRAAKEDKERFL